MAGISGKPLGLGGTSGPIRTRFGFFLFWLDSMRRSPGIPHERAVPLLDALHLTSIRIPMDSLPEEIGNRLAGKSRLQYHSQVDGRGARSGDFADWLNREVVVRTSAFNFGLPDRR